MVRRHRGYQLTGELGEQGPFPGYPGVATPGRDDEALRRLGGFETAKPETVRVILAEGVESDGRESYLRAVVTRENGVFTARLTVHQGSGNLFSLVQANALLIIASGVKSCPPGTELEAWLLEN